ncbi:MAG: hypothetical protein Q7K55_03380 [Candidatus Levybacteria bacterium]|nr:hypothetical protein [Candidatus Levybacteria bacterium]
MKEGPSNLDIFYALISIDNNSDWDEQILEKADPKKIQKVRGLLEEGHLLNEAEIELENLPEERRLDENY